jgi:hypothetical protein
MQILTYYSVNRNQNLDKNKLAVFKGTAQRGAMILTVSLPRPNF